MSRSVFQRFRLPLEEIMTNLPVACLLFTECIPTKCPRNDIEGIYVELNLLRKSWLLCYTYNTNVNIIEKHSHVLERSLVIHFANYKNLMIICDPNADVKSELREMLL